MIHSITMSAGSLATRMFQSANFAGSEILFIVSERAIRQSPAARMAIAGAGGISAPIALQRCRRKWNGAVSKYGWVRGASNPSSADPICMTTYSYKGEADFESIRQRAEALYAAIGSVACPYFGGDPVIFDDSGMGHLKVKSNGRKRPRKDLFARLKLLHLAPQVIKLSRTVQGISGKRQFELQKFHNRFERVLRDVRFYEFLAVIDSVRVRVIVKEIAGGHKHFWSIIPAWKQNRQTHERLLYDECPAMD